MTNNERYFEVLPLSMGIRFRVDRDESVHLLVDVYDHDPADITASAIADGTLPTLEELEQGVADGRYEE